jgi:hypothetical protein
MEMTPQKKAARKLGEMDVKETDPERRARQAKVALG